MNLIYLTVAGSQLYGLETPYSPDREKVEKMLIQIYKTILK